MSGGRHLPARTPAALRHLAPARPGLYPLHRGVPGAHHLSFVVRGALYASHDIPGCVLGIPMARLMKYLGRSQQSPDRGVLNDPTFTRQGERHLRAVALPGKRVAGRDVIRSPTHCCPVPSPAARRCAERSSGVDLDLSERDWPSSNWDDAEASRGVPRSAMAAASSMQNRQFSAFRRLLVTPNSRSIIYEQFIPK
jgi:hypothetical protein